MRGAEEKRGWNELGKKKDKLKTCMKTTLEANHIM